MFFLEIFRGQTNILRNRGGGGGLQLKCIKLKPAKAQGGGGARPFSGGGGECPPQTPLKILLVQSYMYSVHVLMNKQPTERVYVFIPLQLLLSG